MKKERKDLLLPALFIIAELYFFFKTNTKDLEMFFIVFTFIPLAYLLVSITYTPSNAPMSRLDNPIEIPTYSDPLINTDNKMNAIKKGTYFKSSKILTINNLIFLLITLANAVAYFIVVKVSLIY